MEQRELKFRLWNGEEMIQWDPNGAMVLSYTWSLEEIMAGRAPKDHVLMQYTGLKDRTGKEIWEGDIVKMDPREYGDDSSARVVQWVNGGFLESMWSVSDLISWVDVIGNIYENPDLLK